MFCANAFELHIADAQDMRQLGAMCATACQDRGRVVFFLDGNLGTGKTTFSQGFLQGLGYPGRVKSPTYTLVEPYQTAKHTVYHLDLYRLADPEELEYLGLRDEVNAPALWLVEWPERGRGGLPTADMIITIHHAGNARCVYLQAHTPQGEAVMESLNIKYPLLFII